MELIERKTSTASCVEHEQQTICELFCEILHWGGERFVYLSVKMMQRPYVVAF